MPPPSITMTTMPKSINTTDYEQPQSALHIYEVIPSAYEEQHTCKVLPMPHPPPQGFPQHSYPKNTKQGYHLGQEPPLDYEETSFGYPPQHTYEYMSPAPRILPSKYWITQVALLLTVYNNLWFIVSFSCSILLLLQFFNCIHDNTWNEKIDTIVYLWCI